MKTLISYSWYSYHQLMLIIVLMLERIARWHVDRGHAAWGLLSIGEDSACADACLM